jgi:hypothetical protein
MIVLITIVQHASVKSAVVTGCPGVLNPACAGSRRRNTKTAAPVNPKKMKSVATT